MDFLLKNGRFSTNCFGPVPTAPRGGVETVPPCLPEEL